MENAACIPASREMEDAQAEISALLQKLSEKVTPQLYTAISSHEKLLVGRVKWEANRLDRERWNSLLKLKFELVQHLDGNGLPKQKWDGISTSALRELCDEIEKVLEEWTCAKKVQIAFVHSGFACGLLPLPLMEYAS